MPLLFAYGRNRFSKDVAQIKVVWSTAYLFEPGHAKMCLMSYANNKGADQPAQSDQHLCCSLLR